MRTEKVVKNSFWGIVYQIVNIILGFVGRTVFIKILGSEYLGISGLFTNVLSVLSLTELGFSSAIAFHLYKHLEMGEHEIIAGIMNFYKNAYRVIALCVLGMGMAVVPFLPNIIKHSDFSMEYVCWIYIIYLVKTVCSYFFAYKYTLITADQKGYILTNIDTISRFIITGINILTLVIFKNYIIFLVTEIIIGFLFSFIKARVVSLKYSYLNQEAKIEKGKKQKITKDVRNIFAGKVSHVIVTSTDNILISALVSIKVVGIYSNYSLIIGYVQTFLNQFTYSTQASLGNMFASEKKEYAYQVMKKLMVILYFMASIASVCLYNLLNPFVELWIGKQYLLKWYEVLVCVLVFFVQIIKTPLWNAVSSVGYFKQDRNIAVVGAVSNLLISLLLAHFWGLSGIFAGTLFSQLIQWIMKAKLITKKYFSLASKEFLILSFQLLMYVVILCGSVSCIVQVLNVNNQYLNLIIRLIISVVFSGGFNYIVFGKSDAYYYIIDFVKNYARKLKVKRVG